VSLLWPQGAHLEWEHPPDQCCCVLTSSPCSGTITLNVPPFRYDDPQPMAMRLTFLNDHLYVRAQAASSRPLPQLNCHNICIPGIPPVSPAQTHCPALQFSPWRVVPAAAASGDEVCSLSSGNVSVQILNQIKVGGWVGPQPQHWMCTHPRILHMPTGSTPCPPVLAAHTGVGWFGQCGWRLQCLAAGHVSWSSSVQVHRGTAP
jgi:hypothetical protein